MDSQRSTLQKLSDIRRLSKFLYPIRRQHWISGLCRHRGDPSQHYLQGNVQKRCRTVLMLFQVHTQLSHQFQARLWVARYHLHHSPRPQTKSSPIPIDQCRFTRQPLEPALVKETLWQQLPRHQNREFRQFRQLLRITMCPTLRTSPTRHRLLIRASIQEHHLLLTNNSICTTRAPLSRTLQAAILPTCIAFHHHRQPHLVLRVVVRLRILRSDPCPQHRISLQHPYHLQSTK
jgi:hypothetical protein